MLLITIKEGIAKKMQMKRQESGPYIGNQIIVGKNVIMPKSRNGDFWRIFYPAPAAARVKIAVTAVNEKVRLLQNLFI